MKKTILFLMVAILLSSACKKLIDGPDHSTLSTDLIFSTSRDLDNLLYGAYGAIAHGSTLGGNWRIFSELLADHVIVNVNDNIPDDPYQQVYNRDLVNAQYAESWRLAYVAIQNANTVIYGIENNLVTKEKDPEFNDLERDKMMGEARFIRAICYFELVRMYGKPYQFTTLPTQSTPGLPSPLNSLPNSGVILRTKPAINVTGKDDIIGQGRSTVEETYQLIISDLKLASELLPSTSLQGAIARRGRATSYAASAILARVYFQQNDYPNALIEINKVLGSTPGEITTRFKLIRANAATVAPTAAQAQSNVLAAFKSTTAANEIVSENIFDLVSVAGYPVNGVVNRKFFRSATIEPHLAISKAFITDAAFHANDTRKLTGLIAVAGVKNYTRKYDQVLMNIPVIRSAELLLDRAEINAMQAATLPNGSAAHLAALADLTLIRSRAIANAAEAFPTITTVNSANILAKVRTERIKELAFEGDRLHNLRRLNAVVGPGDRTGSFNTPWNSNKLLFKIPDAEIKTSKNIVQNPDVD